MKRIHDSDPLAPARGIVNSILLSLLGWLPLFGVVFLYIVLSA